MQNITLQALISAENNPDLILRLTTDLRIQYVNPSVETAVGIPRDILLGRLFGDVPWAANLPTKEWAEGLQAIIASGQDQTGETIFPSPGGNRYFHVRVVHELKGPDSLPSILVVARDITDHKKKDEHVARLERTYRDVFENAGIAILVLDTDLKILLGNSEAENIVDLPRSYIEGKSVLDFVVPGDRELVRNIAALRNRDPSLAPRSYEVQIQDRHGVKKNILVIDNIILEKGLRVTSLLDITELNRAREKLMREREVLEHQLKSSAANLSKTDTILKSEIDRRKGIERRLAGYKKRIGSLAAELADLEEQERRKLAQELHDHLGQKLAISKIRLDLMREEADPDQKRTLDDISSYIAGAIQDARSIMKELSPPIPRELDFRSAANWLIDGLQSNFGINIFFDPGENGPDPEPEIRLILMRSIREIMMNSIKHSRAVNVNLKIVRKDPGLWIYIEDDGVGFDPKKIGERTGFGLRSIRDNMLYIGGDFEIESSPGHGTQTILKSPLKMKTALQAGNGKDLEKELRQREEAIELLIDNIPIERFQRSII